LGEKNEGPCFIDQDRLWVSVMFFPVLRTLTITNITMARSHKISNWKVLVSFFVGVLPIFGLLISIVMEKIFSL